MLLKLGVDISRLKRPIRRKLNAIDRHFFLNNHEAVITSTYEGTHSPSSLHYCNLAIDLRLPTGMLNHELIEFVDGLKKEIGKLFDVLLERDHIHIEYDPK